MAMPVGKALICTANSNLHRKKIKGFKCERSAVTNASLTAFVQDTGYVTEAEQLGRSFVFYNHVAPEHGETQGVLGTEWWRRVEDENRCYPNRSGFSRTAIDLPVTQVSWNDATAYADG